MNLCDYDYLELIIISFLLDLEVLNTKILFLCIFLCKKMNSHGFLHTALYIRKIKELKLILLKRNFMIVMDILLM